VPRLGNSRHRSAFTARVRLVDERRNDGTARHRRSGDGDLAPWQARCAALLFFVYLGFEEIANLAEEVRNPGRDLPIALFVSLGVTTGLYVAVSFAVLGLATLAELAGSEAPLAAAVQIAWSGAAGTLRASRFLPLQTLS
jgi:amino acid transporter